MGIALKVIGGLLTIFGFYSKDAGFIILGIVLFLVGFWLGSATRDYLNRK